MAVTGSHRKLHVADFVLSGLQITPTLGIAIRENAPSIAKMNGVRFFACKLCRHQFLVACT